MGGEPITGAGATNTGSTSLDGGIGIARIALRAILFFVIAAWVGALPLRLGIMIFDEQFILSMIGLASALIYIGDHDARHPLLRAVDILLAGAALALFAFAAFVMIPQRMASPIEPSYFFSAAMLMVLCVLEATRRKTGLVLPVLVLILTFYFAFIGPNLPIQFATLPLDLDRNMSRYALGNVAMMGRIMNIVGLVVIPFIVFGFLLNAFGGGVFFTGLATTLVGRFRGGPAKVSVVGSAAFGMISGSAVANVVTIGAVSIPLMARTGYRRHVAAAIEAVTSTGGQLMPPIMGASAFLMAEFLEIPYADIVVAAILPAIFFYIALFLSVDFEARRLDIKPSSPESLGLTTGGGWVKGWPYLLPVGVLMYLLFIEHRTAAYASFYTVIALMAVQMFWPKKSPHGGPAIAIVIQALSARLKHLVKATLNCMGASTEIIMLGATAGVIMGLLHKTGFASNVTQQMVILSQGHLWILLTLCGILGLFLGMGMPTVGVYILLALLAAPSLVELGVQPIAAHLYVLYFGMLSMITPPVAIASFAAASVAETNPWKTSFASIRVGAGVYLVPIAFVTQPELLFMGDLGDLALAAFRLLIAVSLFTAVFIGHAMRRMTLPLRVIAAPVAVLNVLPFTGGGLDIYLWVALAASIVLLGAHLIARRDPGAAPEPQAAD